MANKKSKAFFSFKTNAYALPLAMFIFIVIIILSGSLVLSAHYNNLYYRQIRLKDKLNSNANSAINILLSDPEKVGYFEQKALSLYGEFGDSVTIQKEMWGVFDLITVTAFCRNIKIKRSAMTGSYRYDSTNIALFVPDQGKPISVSGNVNISGKCFIPESGIKQTNIENKNFTGKKINGSIKKSSSSLPKLSDRITCLTLPFFIDKYVTSDSKFILFEELGKDTIATSLIDTTIIIYSSSKIKMEDILLQGKIIIISETCIEIQSSAKINNIICVAPYISVKDNFCGKVQLFAEDSIHIEKNCILKYPSVAGISTNNNTIAQSIRIEESSKINGIIFLYRKSENQKKIPTIRLASKSTVKGQIYCNGNTEIKGNIYGAIYTSKFILSTPSSLYENTITDTEINMYKLSKNYVGADLINEGSTGNIIKWIY